MRQRRGIGSGSQPELDHRDLRPRAEECGEPQVKELWSWRRLNSELARIPVRFVRFKPISDSESVISGVILLSSIT